MAWPPSFALRLGTLEDIWKPELSRVHNAKVRL